MLKATMIFKNISNINFKKTFEKNGSTVYGTNFRHPSKAPETRLKYWNSNHHQQHSAA
jgi:hypothetical protein